MQNVTFMSVENLQIKKSFSSNEETNTNKEEMRLALMNAIEMEPKLPERQWLLEQLEQKG